MKRPGLAALVSVGIGAAVWSAAAGSNVLRPPLAFQGDTWAVVQWVDITKVDAACREMGANVGGRIQGCAKGRAVILPNPCRFEGFSADVTCHELAHVNGWSHDPPPVPASDQP